MTKVRKKERKKERKHLFLVVACFVIYYLPRKHIVFLCAPLVVVVVVVVSKLQAEWMNNNKYSPPKWTSFPGLSTFLLLKTFFHSRGCFRVSGGWYETHKRDEKNFSET